MTHIYLTERDLEVLSGLACARICFPKSSGWLTPMCFGGRDGSHHSRTASRLVRLGFVESKPRGGQTRGSKLYRITASGKSALRTYHPRHRADAHGAP